MEHYWSKQVKARKSCWTFFMVKVKSFQCSAKILFISFFQELNLIFKWWDSRYEEKMRSEEEEIDGNLFEFSVS